MPNTPKDPKQPSAVAAPGKTPPKAPQPGRFDQHKAGHQQGPGAGAGKRMIVTGKGRGR